VLEVLDPDRLDQVAVRAAGQQPLDGLLRAVAGDHEHRRAHRRRVGLDVRAHHVAVHPRHVEVEHDQVRPERRQPHARLDPVERRLDGAPHERVEHPGQRAHHGRIVVDDEHPVPVVLDEIDRDRLAAPLEKRNEVLLPHGGRLPRPLDRRQLAASHPVGHRPAAHAAIRGDLIEA
jgi:hypothetical protein